MVAPALSNLESFICPRCESEANERFYGPCDACRAALVDKFQGLAKTPEVVEYVPKMNVVPNHVATKD